MSDNKTWPPQLFEAWESRQKTAVFTTVNLQGIPNTIYATSVARYGENKILIANNYFSKTMENILSGSKGSLLFMTKDAKSYQLKGTLTYTEEGEMYEDMKHWNPTRFPGHGVVALEIEEIYKGAEKLR